MDKSVRRGLIILAIAVLSLGLLVACGRSVDIPQTAETMQPETAQPATLFVTEGIAGSNSLAYDLGETIIIQPDVDEAYREMPIPLIGTLSVPEGAGPFPVALVLHGRHTRCYSDEAQLDELWPCPPGTEPRYDIGFSYLLDALAGRGYLAIAPSINGAYTTTWGAAEGALDVIQPVVNTRLIAIVQSHLEQLANGGAGQPVFGEAVDLTGLVDLSRVALVAHSTAGITANLMARDELLPVEALLLLAPMYFENTGETAATTTAVLLSACDGDRPDLPGQTYYEVGRLQERSAPLATVVLEGANHNFYNQELVSQGIDDAFFVRNPDCATMRLAAGEQQAFLTNFATDFIDAAFGKPEPPAFLRADGPAPDVLYKESVRTTLAPEAALRTQLVSPPATASATLPGTAEGSIIVTACAPAERCTPDIVQPGAPGQFKFAWEGVGAIYRIDLPAGAQDAVGADWLRLRVTIDPTDPLNEAAEPVVFSVQLTDTTGAKATIPQTVTLPFPTPGSFEGDGYRYTLLLPWDVRLPLEGLEGIDLTAVSTVSLVFDQTPRGLILLADLEWLRNEL